MRFRSLSGSLAGRLEDEGGAGSAAQCLADRGFSGPTVVRCCCSGLMDEQVEDFSSCGILEREETLADLRRGNGSMG